MVRRASGWTPTLIPNLRLWLDARNGGIYADAGSTLATNGQSVQQWHDASGQGNHVTTNTGTKPTYSTTGMNGYPCLTFAGYQRMVTGNMLSTSYNQAVTMFVVGEPSGSNVNTIAAAAYADGKWSISHRGPWTRYSAANIYEPDAVNHGIQTVAAAGELRIMGISWDGEYWRSISNGYLVKRTLASGNLGLSGVVSVGANISTYSGWWGTIGAVLVWQHGATDAQMRRISDYLMRRYGVAKPAPSAIYMALGDSQTWDYGIPTRPYTGQVIPLVGEDNLAHSSYAIAGAFLSDLMTTATDTVDTHLDSSQTLKITSVFAGGNDLGAGAYANVMQDTEDYCNARRAAGWDKILVFTVPARSPSNPGVPPGYEADRVAFNSSLRANYISFADGIVDIAAHPIFDSTDDTSNLTYYWADGVHYTQDGHAVIAGILAPILTSYIEAL